MRHFPFKTLILCVLLPPFIYVFSLQFLEKTIQARYAEELAMSYTGDIRQLFNGSVRLQEAIRENVDAFISSRKLTAWGLRMTITVKTKDGVYLYPDTYDDPKSDIGGTDSIVIARENFRLLNEGLIRTVDVKIEHNTLISILILTFCVTGALVVLFLFYRRGASKSRAEDLARQAMIDGLATERRDGMAKLEELESQRDRLGEKIETMRGELARERQKASAAEDEMVDELVAMEEKIGENLEQQALHLQEIDSLREKIQQFERESEIKTRQQVKGVDAAKKRFNTLYKRITVHDRAIEGFVDLTEEMKIKAEEVVHQLNDDSKKVLIKRKVFGKKNRETVFEVIFAYKGRLYFRNISGNQIEVLVIGTKLSQNKDLAFLDKL
jgi:hypothetical protein